jgi:hypothetical protein
MPMQPMVRRLLGAVSADQTRLGRISGAESRRAEVLRKERRLEGRGIMEGKCRGRSGQYSRWRFMPGSGIG